MTGALGGGWGAGGFASGAFGVVATWLVPETGMPVGAEPPIGGFTAANGLAGE